MNIKDVIEEDIKLFNKDNLDKLSLNEDKNNMYSLMCHTYWTNADIEIWYGTINEINVAVKSLCRFMEEV